MRILLLTLSILLPGAVIAGSPRIAEQIRKEYELATAKWAIKLQEADDGEQQMAIWQQRPDANHYAARMWEELEGSLHEDWTLDYSAWLLEYAPVFAAQAAEGGDRRTPVQNIVRALERFHIESPKVGFLCLALTSLPDPKTLALVERVAKENPDKTVQGQAALAIAMLLRGLGDDRDVMVQRLSRLREAIIKAADTKVGDVTVGKLAEDEIYVIQHLSKNRTAPDVLGRDVTGTPFKLSLLEDKKVIVLAFWHSNMRDAERGIGLLRNLHQKHADRGMALIGVTTDPVKVLRNLKANGTVPWRNFVDSSGRITRQYRVRNLPLVYVMDAERTIQFIGGPGAFVDLTVEALLAEDDG